MNATAQYQLTAPDLEVLLALARGGNLAEAGKRLGADPSTVFRSVQRIEKQLGQTLFNRSRRGYLPSEMAQQIVTHAEKIEAELEAARAASLASQDEVSGLVRLTTTDSVLYGLVIPLLGGLMQKHPHLELELMSSNEVVNLTKRDADIAIRATVKPSEHLIGHHLGRASFAVYGSAEVFKGKRIKPLDEYDWVVPDEAMPEHPVVKWRRKNYPKSIARYRVNSQMALAEAVRAGLGIAVLSTYKARHDPRLKALTPVLEGCSTDLWILTHPESRHLRRISTVYNYFAKAIRLD
ncbi:MAG: LysR family transcriptional regulator [Betaproteobacteria bacterium]|nr:LysR family transcriptional regulator [Betaproteobacteria bacterium]